MALVQNMHHVLAAVQQGMADLQQGMAAMQAVFQQTLGQQQQTLEQQQQTLAAILQELRVLRAQKFNFLARQRNSARAKPHHDLQLVPLQVSVVDITL